MEEIWRDVKGYEGLYQVSNFGRVKSLRRLTRCKNDSYGIVKERILKTSLHNGYRIVSFLKDNKRKTFSVHRLVAIAFIANPDNLPQINHKDEIKSNSIANNLEWCTHKYNCNYGSFQKNKAKSNSKKTYKTSIDGEILGVYDSLKEAATANAERSGSVSNCIGGRLKTLHGFLYKH